MQRYTALTTTIKIIIGFCLLLVIRSSFAIEPFVITDVIVKGNGRIDDGTIFNYLPLKVGDEVDDDEARHSIKALFDTGFFRNVKLTKQGSSLVVEVEERPSIAGINIVGNKDIDSDQIIEMLDSVDLIEGRIFNQRRLNEVIKGLSDAYFSRGRYSAEIQEEITLMDQNRARITLNIDEGRVAKIKEINIIGLEAFSKKKILKELKLTTKRGFGLRPQNLYSKQKLEGDQETLRSFYADHGYFEFNIRSTNVTISSNKQDINLFISLNEGPQYKMGTLSIDADDSLNLDGEAIFAETKPDDVYSRKVISDARKAISDILADNGFGSSRVTPVPTPNKSEKIIDVRFIVDQGARLYVRRINIQGNTVTQEDVIRRELRQLEGSRFSAANIRRSQERLQRLGFFEDVRIDSVPVPGMADQVDIQVVVVERTSTGNVSFSVGYADVEGALYQIGYNQRNFLGTGKELVIEVDNSSVTDVYEVRYTNPFYTVSGVSRGVFLTASKVDSAEADTAEYYADTIELGLNYKIPISEENNVSLAFFTENIKLDNSTETPPELKGFIDSNPDNTSLGTRVSIGKDTLNDFIFPTSGTRSSISLDATLPGGDLEYYKLNLAGSKYFELSRSGFSFLTKLRLGYGDDYGNNGDLPFYKNYFAGGSGTVRGFRSRSLGPEDTGDTPEPLGGDRLIAARLELLTPAYGNVDSKDKRFTFFVDGGMVYGPVEDVDLGEMRYSAGISLQWYTIIGPLTLSFALPLNDEEGDDLQKFQISLGSLFR